MRLSTTTLTTPARMTNEREAWSRRLDLIADAVGRDVSASINRIADQTERPDPFRVLIGTIISLRTKDAVTFAASERLFARAETPAALSRVPREEVEQLIYPAGFYRSKAATIQTICEILVRDHGGDVPRTLEDLIALPGVGRKTANLVLGVGHGIPAICVDTHVHRIPNRIGWVETRTPEQTEAALADILPREFWIPINELLVLFGQQICTPVSPRCSVCPLAAECLRRGVERSR